MSETSDYTRNMLNMFTEKYDEAAPLGSKWSDLSHAVRAGLVKAFIATAEQIQGDMY